MKKRNVNILTGGGGRLLTAFTMAEILLSLTIIGVVAAITLPGLTGNINERTWNTQRKALYARMSQAIALMPSLNGYGTLTEDESGSIEDTAAETFITDGLSKVLKINNICDNEHLEDCGIPTKLLTIDATSTISFPKALYDLNAKFNVSWTDANSYSGSYSQINSKAAAFETANGESIAVFYNPYCSADAGETNYYTQPKMCANFVYDLNGSKGPNTVGKDVGFITALYPSDSVVVAPLPYHYKASWGSTQVETGAYCRNQTEESRLPNKEELSAMFYNRNIIGNVVSTHHWSGSVIDNQYGWALGFYHGQLNKSLRSSTFWAWCIRR